MNCLDALWLVSWNIYWKPFKKPFFKKNFFKKSFFKKRNEVWSILGFSFQGISSPPSPAPVPQPPNSYWGSPQCRQDSPGLAHYICLNQSELHLINLVKIFGYQRDFEVRPRWADPQQAPRPPPQRAVRGARSAWLRGLATGFSRARF